ncbi:protein tyrosine phosphatase type IVA 2-like [Notothenia coriiceps]|uniref:Protein tyrosine phosphatase type IVA 2-like n=1 Tax=Notothenia coriiceps TaxID=8208 RepID=A0A6I9MJ62_9TELE|nr:PREDICTED: protein tyrosine phosphatase type IVA 2-like [Notothenia coriiceps]
MGLCCADMMQGRTVGNFFLLENNMTFVLSELNTFDILKAKASVMFLVSVLRAPVLVALALIECGMEYEDAVHFIRLKRRGAFNSKQLLYLESYKPKLCLRSKDGNGQSCCIQ